MKNRLVIAIVIFLGVIVIAAAPERSSSGAPGAHTGAPGEQTCATSGCHDDNKLNSGFAALSIEIGSDITNYIPGKTYQVKVKIAEPNVNRFGFQLLAFNPSTLSSVGSFQIADPIRTQLVRNPAAFTDREYVTYSFKGTDPTSEGMSEWVVNWTAPPTAVGPVSFYAAGVSANDDMTDKNDRVYTTSKVLIY
ncbi:MAG: hypothetical protein IPP64_03805 [Bacteroidetes bacterium]|nr:hypothetical protein [Bacteroidota bacterium]